MKTPYASRAKEMRTKRAWSQEQLATIADVDARTIQRIERGERVSFETLKALANAFDIEVGDLLAPDNAKPAGTDKSASNGATASTTPSQRVLFLGRVRTGRELFNIAAGTHMFGFDHDELGDPEVDVVASFLQDLKDYSEMWDDIEPGERVRAAHSFNERITELEQIGLWVFAGSHRRPYQITAAMGAQVITMDTATVMITKPTNPAIIPLEGEDAALPVAYRLGN